MSASYILPRDGFTTDREYFDKLNYLRLAMENCEPSLRAAFDQYCQEIADAPTTIYSAADLSDISSLPTNMSRLPTHLVAAKFAQSEPQFRAYERANAAAAADADRRPVLTSPAPRPRSVDLSHLRQATTPVPQLYKEQNRFAANNLETARSSILNEIAKLSTEFDQAQVAFQQSSRQAQADQMAISSIGVRMYELEVRLQQVGAGADAAAAGNDSNANARAARPRVNSPRQPHLFQTAQQQNKGKQRAVAMGDYEEEDVEGGAALEAALSGEAEDDEQLLLQQQEILDLERHLDGLKAQILAGEKKNKGNNSNRRRPQRKHKQF